MEEILLCVRGEVFQVRKENVCKYSDYFRSMFSGKYVEDQLGEISIDMFEPSTMSIILQYMNTGAINLSEHSWSTIGDIAAAADYLLITDLKKQIEQTLNETDLCESNWMEIMTLAESCSFLNLENNLEQLSVAFGLYSFKRMSAEHIPTIQKLAWYLSHPYLDSQSEVDVFKFGLQWVLNNGADADALLIILACLDFTRLAQQDLQDIKNCLKQQEFVNSLAAAVVHCLLEVSNDHFKISESVIDEHRNELSDKFTERVWTETKAVVSKNNSRLLNYTAVVPSFYSIFDGDGAYGALTEHGYVFRTFNKDVGFEDWFRVSDTLCGVNATSWGLMKVVVLYQELITGNEEDFLTKVKVYDVLRKKWIHHEVNISLPSSYFPIVVLKDLLYFVGGTNYIGEDSGKLTTTVTIYDLKQKTYKTVANLPEDSSALVCSHNNMLYAALKSYIYCYEDDGNLGSWKSVVKTNNILITCITSYKGYIYCIERNSTLLYRFRPYIDNKLEKIVCFEGCPTFLVNTGNNLLAYTRHETKSSLALVEEVKEENKVITCNTIYRDTKYNVSDKFVRAGAFAVATTLPPLN